MISRSRNPLPNLVGPVAPVPDSSAFPCKSSRCIPLKAVFPERQANNVSPPRKPNLVRGNSESSRQRGVDGAPHKSLSAMDFFGKIASRVRGLRRLRRVVAYVRPLGGRCLNAVSYCGIVLQRAFRAVGGWFDHHPWAPLRVSTIHRAKMASSLTSHFFSSGEDRPPIFQAPVCAAVARPLRVRILGRVFLPNR